MFVKPCVSKWLPVNFPVTETFKFSVFGNVTTFVSSKSKTIKLSKYLHIIRVFCCQFSKITKTSVLCDSELLPIFSTRHDRVTFPGGLREMK